MPSDPTKTPDGSDGSPEVATNEIGVPPAARAYRIQRSAARVVAARAAAAQSPFSAMVEIADRCNEACVHCYQVQGQKGELDTDQWKRIFDQLAQLGVIFLTISGGEPTLRKDFMELVAYARRLRFAVKIYSNALNITADVASELGRLGVQEVQISLYSCRAEVHDAVTRVPGSFEKVCSAVRHLRGAQVKVVLKSPLMRSNAAEFSEYMTFVKDLGADYQLDPKVNPREDGDLGPTQLAISKATYLAARRDSRLAVSKPGGSAPLDSRPCGACVGNVHLEPNGELRPCTQWSIPTGHALRGDLQASWRDDPVANAIRELRWRDLPACRVCDLRNHCHRCFAEAERYTGNALAAYGRACLNARWKYESEYGVEPEIDSLDGWCDAQPIGPFRSDGEHRFVVERAEDHRTGTAELDRSWLPEVAKHAVSSHMAPVQLVHLRRRAAAPLTPRTPPPSDP